MVTAGDDDFRLTVAGFGEAGWREFDFGVVCGVRLTRGLARGDLLLACRDSLGVTGDAGIDRLVPSDFVDSEELAAVFSGVVLRRRPPGLQAGTELIADFRGAWGLLLPNAVGGERSDVIGDPSVCCFGVSFGEFDGNRPVNDFLFPRTGLGLDTSGDSSLSVGEVSVIEGLTMRGRALFEPLFGVDDVKHGSRLVRLLSR